MRLFEEFRAEHVRIDRLAGSLLAFADRFAGTDAPREDGMAILDALAVYAGGYHHDREELVLFPALERAASLPRTGPIAALLEDHHETGALLGAMTAELAGPAPDPARFRESARRYARILRAHIDAENSVLFPEGEARLARAGVRELEGRAPTEAELAAADAADRLAALYPPADDPDVIRGDGCVFCPRFAESCDGIERAWWNDYEWDEMEEHVAAS